MLTDDNIKDGSLYISKTRNEWWEMWDFFDDCKKVCKKQQGEFYPVILVVDEVSTNINVNTLFEPAIHISADRTLSVSKSPKQ